MQLSPIGLSLAELDTPALLLDLDNLAFNIKTMADHFRSRGVEWRPHAKAYKTPAIAHELRKAGAIGVTVAKVSEAEVMVAGGIDDILIAHLVVGPTKTARLAALQRRADVKVTVDHVDHLAPLSRAAQAAGVEIGVLVDVDLGMQRCGVASPEQAIDLAGKVSKTAGLRFDGLMGYEGHTLGIPDPKDKKSSISEAIGRLIAAKEAVLKAGFPCRIISAGGSGSYQYTPDIPGLTEIQAGGGIFACQYYTQVCQVRGHRPAIAVRATVVSRPAPDRAILDIGHKSISGHGSSPVIQDRPGCRVVKLSAEHAAVELEQGEDLRIGEQVNVVPGYSDFTFVLHDRVIGHRGNRVEVVWELLGRGKLQ